MTPHTVTIVLNVLLVAGGLFTLYGLYFAGIALFGFKKRQENPEADPTTRFALLIAARNEEQVIGHLVDSLKQQNYPEGMYEIFVAPNNCKDETRDVALAHGATIFDPVGEIHSKGEVLTQLIDKLMAENQFDAICVFDADNLVHPDFLQKMNNARHNGVKVAQGFRDSKNPGVSPVSTSYSVCYWMLNRFYNGGRQAVGLSGLVNGSGFMVSMELLRRLGGWHTRTMTEDYEFSAQCVLNGEKVSYVSGAVIYDEQPLTFSQSWKQRRRWSTGSVQGMELYLSALVNHSIKKRTWISMDMALTFLMPIVQVVSLSISAITMVLSFYRIYEFQIIPLAQVLWGMAFLGLFAFFACTLLAAFVVRLNLGEKMGGTGKGIIYFAIFLLSWLPISIISLFKRQKTWDDIAHTCSTSIQDVRK